MRLTLAVIGMLVVAVPVFSQQEIPKAADPRLVVELVAQAPDIVHPISCDFDHLGRLLVIESHTHFAPKGYAGPKFDRIRAFDVKTGKATTFFEGTRHTMDLAVHPDGSVYLATRNEILRLRETKDGVKSERIVFLDTKGDYPHNGLSGLCFDFAGELYFGMGENLGARYTLIDSEDRKFPGEGDGGHIFHCTADGKKLRRVATGFWNPFGNCRDIYGRLFCVDNDPDQAPPCRMLHVVEGGDYGFRFCYGRSGKHPFQSWHGELPGTLPMMTGVGEAPCEILSYESDGLPKEYLGQLLVTSWADHRVERYKVVPHGASFKAERLPFVQGPSNFRPTGMCVAPDGSIYVADWVKSDYTLHGKGAIWRIREKQSRERKRPADPREAILSLHRPLRDAAAQKLASSEDGRQLLRKHLDHADIRVRAGALAGLFGRDLKEWRRQQTAKLFTNEKMLAPVVNKDAEPGMRGLAMEALGLSSNTIPYLDGKHPPALTMAAVLWGDVVVPDGFPKLAKLLGHDDPFLQHAVAYRLGQGVGDPDGLRKALDAANLRKASEREGRFLVDRNQLTDFNRFRLDLTPSREMAEKASEYLRGTDEMLRFLAAKWIADEKLEGCRKDVLKVMQDPKLSVRMYTACATALARLDGKDVNEKSLADYFAKRLSDDATPAAQRAMLLRQVPATHPKLTVEFLANLLKTDDAILKMEVVRALVDHNNAKREAPLLKIFANEKESANLRRFALLGLNAASHEEVFSEVAKNKNSPLHDDAAWALIFAKLHKGEIVREPEKGRPAAKDIDAWLKRLDGPADANAGARVFFQPKLGTCSRCHRIDGRGADVGPDLSSIGRTDRRHILESILQPSNTVAPHYVAWHLETADGKVKNGMLVHTQLDEYTYLDTKGDRFKLKTGDLVEQRPLTTSIMPDGLVERLTDQEIRDLLAYLQARR